MSIIKIDRCFDVFFGVNLTYPNSSVISKAFHHQVFDRMHLTIVVARMSDKSMISLDSIDYLDFRVC